MPLFPGTECCAGPTGEQGGPDPCSHELYILGTPGSGGSKAGGGLAEEQPGRNGMGPETW